VNIMPPRQNKNVFYFFLIILFILLGIKLFHLQIYELNKYKAYSERNRIRRVILQPTRGLILDRTGQVLVDNRPSYSLRITPYDYNTNDSVKTVL
jgi:penicillin-binding protein 2